MKDNETTLFDVIVTNDILGNSCHTMSMMDISKFNICAKMCAELCVKDGKEHSMGMWTVRPHVMSEEKE